MVRLLDRLCDLHPGQTREELLSLVLCGEVRVNGARIRDPREPVGSADTIAIAKDRYVGRGGYKLDHALETWRLAVAGRVVLDAGASTGGFTDCLLQHGARAVHAVDVGHNQLDFRLRSDPRVILHERTNVMNLDELNPPPAYAVADLSFRSLSGAAGHVVGLTTDRAAVLLVKPQFEWIDAPAEFSGTVPDGELPAILGAALKALADEGLVLRGLLESPITGRKGNREFLLLTVESDESPWASGLPPSAAPTLVADVLGEGGPKRSR